MLYGKEIAAASDKAAAEKKFEDVYADANSSMEAAEKGYVDMVINPAHSRQYLIASMQAMIKR